MMTNEINDFQIALQKGYESSADIVGEITPETILNQCIRMSNNNLWAFFAYSPHLPKKKQVDVQVRLGNLKDEPIYSAWDDENYHKTLAEIMSDLVKIESEQENV